MLSALNEIVANSEVECQWNEVWGVSGGCLLHHDICLEKIFVIYPILRIENTTNPSPKTHHNFRW